MGVFEVEEEEEEEEEEPEEPSERFGLSLECEETTRVVTSGSSNDFEMMLENLGDSEDTVQIKFDLMYSQEEEGEHSEWTVKIEGLSKDVWDVTLTEKTQTEIEMRSHEKKEFTVDIIAPRGPKYGDRLNVVATATSRGDPALSDMKTISATIRQMITASTQHSEKIIYPVFNQKRGHPPLIPVSLAPTISKWCKDGSLRDVLGSFESLSLEVNVSDENILLDINTTDDYNSVVERF